jgi:hypothetical protein
MSQSLDITAEHAPTFPARSRQMLNKGPAVTAFVWIINVLATTRLLMSGRTCAPRNPMQRRVARHCKH